MASHFLKYNGIRKVRLPVASVKILGESENLLFQNWFNSKIIAFFR